MRPNQICGETRVNCTTWLTNVQIYWHILQPLVLHNFNHFNHYMKKILFKIWHWNEVKVQTLKKRGVTPFDSKRWQLYTCDVFIILSWLLLAKNSISKMWSGKLHEGCYCKPKVGAWKCMSRWRRKAGLEYLNADILIARSLMLTFFFKNLSVEEQRNAGKGTQDSYLWVKSVLII